MSTGYGDVDLAIAILDKERITLQGADEYDELVQINADLSRQLDDHLHRSFTTSGTGDDPVIWLEDAPLGPLLPLEDFTEIVQVLAYGVDVTADCLPRKVNRRWAAYQSLLYAPLGVQTGWIGEHTTSLQQVEIHVIAGWPAVPEIIVRAQTEALCRNWRARLNMYADGGGVGGSTVNTPTPILDADFRSKVADYVRKLVVPIGGP